MKEGKNEGNDIEGENQPRTQVHIHDKGGVELWEYGNFKLENLGEDNHESPVLTALHPTGLDVKAGNWVIRCLVLEWGCEFST